MKSLKEGYVEFKRELYKENKELFEDLVDYGQKPKTFFVTCSDSRVVPNLITNSKPGDLFITRNIGNFIPPYQEGGQYLATASALEYAVGVLEVEEVIICAHSECGAIGTLFKPIEPTPNNIHIVNWLSLGNEARDKALKSLPKASMKELRDFTEKINAVIQLNNLMSYPLVKERVKSGKLELKAWHYNIRTGEILEYDRELKEYVPLEELEEIYE
jgi:carbonic anhydrase